MKKILFLKHNKPVQNEEKILGFFDAQIINEIIAFYSSLPGFCNTKNGEFDYSKSVYTNKKYVYLFQVWNKNDEDISIFEEVFANKTQAEDCLEDFKNRNDMSNLDSQIEKYTIGQKYWTDGYFEAAW